MIRITIDDEPLDLFPRRAITLDFVSPVFYRELTRRHYSFPVRVPATARNARLLGHPERHDAYHAVESELSAAVYLGPARILSGPPRITAATQDSYELSISEAPSLPSGKRLLDALDEVKLHDVVPAESMGSVPDETLRAYTWRFTLRPGFATWQITIGLRSYFSGATGDRYQDMQTLAARINADYPDYAVAIGNPNAPPGTGNDEPGIALRTVEVNRNPFAPGVMDGFVLQRMDPTAKAYIDRARIHRDSTLDDTPVAERLAYPAVYWPDFYEGKNEEWQDFVNPVVEGLGDDAALTPGDFEGEAAGWRVAYVPMLRLRYVLDLIWDAIGATHLGDHPAALWNDMAHLLIWSNYAPGAVVEDYGYADDDELREGPLVKRHRFTGHTDEIPADRLLPNASARDLLEALAEWYGAYLHDDGRLVTFRSKRATLADPSRYRDWSRVITLRTGRSFPEAEGLRLEWGLPRDESAGSKAPDQLQPYVSGRGTRTLTTAAAPLHMVTKAMPLADGTRTDVRVPHSTEKGAGDAKAGRSRSSLRFIHYAGLKPAAGQGLYPLATTEVTDALGNDTGFEALAWEGDRGLFRRHLANVVDLDDRVGIDAEVTLSAPELQELIQWDTAGVTFDHPRGRVRAAVKRVRVRVRPADTELPPCSVQLVDLMPPL